MSQSGFEHHDHTVCISGALTAAETYCRENKLKLTPVRRRVLELLLNDHKALGAYDILAIISSEGLGSQPPVAYRALDFLVTHGFVHKIENRNAYTACTHSGDDHTPAFLICTSCESVVEAHTDPTQGQIDQIAKQAGFTVQKSTIEIEGICPNCAETPAV